MIKFHFFKRSEAILHNCKAYTFKGIILGSAKLWAFINNENNDYLQ